MNFSPQGQPHWKPFIKATKLTPKMVKKEIHGQTIWVKVYPPRWEEAAKLHKDDSVMLSDSYESEQHRRDPKTTPGGEI